MEKYRLKHKKKFKIKKRKPILKRKGVWFLLFFLIIFGVGTYFAVQYKIFEIKEILIFGNQKVKIEEIKPIIEEKITHKILFVKTKNVFLADLEKINKEILLQFPRIKNINLSKDWAGVLSAEVNERFPLGDLCAGNNCYLFDEEGIVFESSTGESRLSIKIEPQDYRITLGKQEISKEVAKGLKTLDNMLRGNFSVELSEIFLFINQQKLEVKISEGWKIYFEPKENFELQILNLNLLLREQISNRERQNLDYIDLRYGNKIFYKKK